MPADPVVIFSPPPRAASPSGTTVRVSSRETQGAFCVCEMITMPGDGVPLHVHEHDEELYYVLEGALQMEAGGRRFTAEAGSVVVIPAHVSHRFRNDRDEPARALVVFRPGGFDDLTEALSRARAAESLDAKRRDAILAKWGVTLLGDDP